MAPKMKAGGRLCQFPLVVFSRPELRLERCGGVQPPATRRTMCARRARRPAADANRPASMSQSRAIRPCRTSSRTELPSSPRDAALSRRKSGSRPEVVTSGLILGVGRSVFGGLRSCAFRADARFAGSTTRGHAETRPQISHQIASWSTVPADMPCPMDVRRNMPSLVCHAQVPARKTGTADGRCCSSLIIARSPRRSCWRSCFIFFVVARLRFSGWEEPRMQRVRHRVALDDRERDRVADGDPHGETRSMHASHRLSVIRARRCSPDAGRGVQ